MTDRIEPALSGEQWAEWRRALDQAHGVVDDTIYNDTVGVNAHECAEIIAYNNDALPDDDPRKFTRSDVGMLRKLAQARINIVTGASEHYDALADRIESYLPPE